METSLFKLQAMCPFKAFAELRLGATELDEAETGLSALDRGLLIHRVLQKIWDVLGSHAGLLSTGDEQLADIVRRTVAAEAVCFWPAAAGSAAGAVQGDRTEAGRARNCGVATA